MAPSSIHLRLKTEVFLNLSHSFTLHTQSLNKTCQLYHKSYALSTVTVSVPQFTISPLDHYGPISTHTKHISSQQHIIPHMKTFQIFQGSRNKIHTLYHTSLQKVAPAYPSYTFYSPPILQPHWPSFWISNTPSLYSRSAPTCSSICLDVCLPFFMVQPE